MPFEKKQKPDLLSGEKDKGESLESAQGGITEGTNPAPAPAPIPAPQSQVREGLPATCKQGMCPVYHSRKKICMRDSVIGGLKQNYLFPCGKRYSIRG